MSNYPYKNTDRQLTDYVTRNEKSHLVLNGRILSITFHSLQVKEFENLTTPWEGTKHFCNGETTYAEFKAYWEERNEVKLQGRLSIIYKGSTTHQMLIA